MSRRMSETAEANRSHLYLECYLKGDVGLERATKRKIEAGEARQRSENTDPGKRKGSEEGWGN